VALGVSPLFHAFAFTVIDWLTAIGAAADAIGSLSVGSTPLVV
jgi:hypothetical protein